MLIQKLKYTQSLTVQERHIADYILANPQIVFEATAHELAKLTYTSSSTVVRLCKKLGVKGYPDFQLKLALELQKDNAQTPLNGTRATLQGNVAEAIEAIPYLYEQTLMETRQMFKEESLKRISEWMKSSERIDIYGVDANYYIVQQASAKWNELGLTAVAHNGANLPI